MFWKTDPPARQATKTTPLTVETTSMWSTRSRPATVWTVKRVSDPSTSPHGAPQPAKNPVEKRIMKVA